MIATTVGGVNVLAELALALAVPAYLVALTAVVLLAVRRAALCGSRRCPRRGTSTR